MGSISAYLDKWTHVAVTVNGTTVTAYLDGSLFGTATGTALSSGANPFAIGAYTAAVNSQSVQGVMDQVRFFSTELTSDQITELYNEVQCPCTTNTVDNPTTNAVYYKLDGNANDSTSGAKNGTWGGTEAYAYGPYGIAGDFNGTSSLITVASSLPWSSSFSLSMWLRPDSGLSATGYYLPFMQKDYDSGVGGVGLAFYLYGYVLSPYIGDLGGSTYPNIFNTGTLTADTWNHVVLTRTYNVQWELFLNGASLGTYTTNGLTEDFSGSEYYFGANGYAIGVGGTPYYYPGQIDQVRIFSSALSATQVTSLYDEVYCNTVSTLNIFNEGTSSCIALYEFEDNADSTDSSTYDGTWTGTEAYGGGQYKKGGIFNGSTSAINLPTLPSNFVGSSARSVSAWVKISSTPSASLTIFNSGTAAQLESFGVFIGTGRQIIISYYNKNWNTSETISLNTWHHIVFTYNGGAVETSSNSAVYIDGTLATLGSPTGSATGSANTTNSNHNIGVYGATSALYFNGIIDQVRLFTKELSATEVLQVYTE